jgi:hypothetical protein
MGSASEREAARLGANLVSVSRGMILPTRVTRAAPNPVRPITNLTAARFDKGIYDILLGGSNCNRGIVINFDRRNGRRLE